MDTMGKTKTLGPLRNYHTIRKLTSKPIILTVYSVLHTRDKLRELCGMTPKLVLR